MIKRIIPAALLCLLLLLNAFPGHEASAAGKAGEYQNYVSTLMSANQALSGSMATKQFDFKVMDYWELDRVVIHLDYEATPLTKQESSSVTLSVNGTKFHSFRPVVNGHERQRLTVRVPIDLIIPGTNTLTVEGYIQTTIDDKVCISPERSNNWMQLYPSSDITAFYTTQPFEGSIREFGHRFSGLDTVSSGESAFGLPLQNNAVELESAAYALSGFSKTNSYKSGSIPFLPYDSSEFADKKFVVVIGRYEQLPEKLTRSLSTTDLSKQALLQVIESDAQTILLVTSSNAELLVKAGRLAGNPDLLDQLSSNSKIVDSSTVVDTPVTNLSKSVQLTQNGDRLTGMKHQERSYFISMPVNRSLASASQVNLDFRYAQNLDFDRSMVTVLVNNIPIGSKKLVSALAEGDTLQVSIPLNAQVSGDFSLTVAFDLELINSGCVEPDQQMPWAFITKDSSLLMQTRDHTELLFNNYPYPYLRDGSFNQIAVALPRQQDEYTLLTISNLFNLLGQYAEGNRGDIHFYEDTADFTELKKANMIAIGGYEDNKLIREVNDNLYFTYSEDGTGFKSNEKITLDTEYGQQLGTLQLINSPFTVGRSLLAVTGPGSDYTYLASKLISNEETKWKIYGDGVITDKDRNIHPYRFKKEAEQEKVDSMAQILKREDLLGFISVAVSLMLLILVSLILLIRKYRRKRGMFDETP